jgi:hypothetical protein
MRSDVAPNKPSYTLSAALNGGVHPLIWFFDIPLAGSASHGVHVSVLRTEMRLLRAQLCKSRPCPLVVRSGDLRLYVQIG